MRKIIFLAFIIGLSLPSLSQVTATNILDLRINKHCFRTADKELEGLAETYLLKLRFDKERLKQYTIDLDFDNETLKDVLMEICKITKSKYYITTDNVIQIIDKKDEKNVNLNNLQLEQDNKKPDNLNPTKFNITVSGKVTDDASGEPLPNVNVVVLNGKNGTTTNADGYFTLYGVPSDTSTLIFSIIGYDPFKHYLAPSQSLESKYSSLI